MFACGVKENWSLTHMSESVLSIIYSRTRAYQTRPAVELVSGEEGLSLSRPLLARHCLRVHG